MNIAIRLVVSLLYLTVLSAFANEPASKETVTYVESANSEYEEQIAESKSRFDEKVATIRNQFLSALEKRMERAIKAGELEDTLKWKEEINRLLNGGIPEEVDDLDSDPDLGALRSAYRNTVNSLTIEHDADFARIARERDVTLENMQQKLTREQRLVDAKYILDSRKSFGTTKQPEIASQQTVEENTGKKWKGELVVHGRVEGKEFQVPLELNTKRFDWLRIDAMRTGFLAGSYEDGVYHVTLEGAKKIQVQPVRDMIFEGTCKGTVLTMNHELRWQVVRNLSKGTIENVEKFFCNCVGGPEGFWSVLALKKDGTLEFKADNVPLKWEFDKWKETHQFKDLAMSEWKGFRAAVFAVTDKGELFAFNNNGLFSLPAWLSNDVESVFVGHSGIGFCVVKTDGSVYDFTSGLLPYEIPLDTYFQRWSTVPSGRFGSKTPIVINKGVSAKTIQFNDGNWIAINSRSGFSPEFHRVITSQGPFKDLKVRWIERLGTDFIVGIR